MNKITISSLKKSEEIEKILNEKSRQGYEVASFSQSIIALRYNVTFKKSKKQLNYTLSSKPLKEKGLKLITDKKVYLYSSKIKPIINEEKRNETDKTLKMTNYWRIVDILYVLFVIFFIVSTKEKPYSMNRLIYVFPTTLVYSLLNLLIRNNSKGSKVALIVTSVLTSAVITVVIELVYMLYKTIMGFFG